MKKIKINIEDLFELKGSEIFNPDVFMPTSNISIDSRSIKKGSIFIAIKGEKFDGHNFIESAIKDGADTVIINIDEFDRFKNLNKTFITVPDTSNAFGELASIWRKKLTAKVIGITGSSGKTSTKDMLTEILSVKFNVQSTKYNNNNHLGVPLTIFSANESTEVLVLELGTNHFGEIDYTANISKPDLALITNIGDSHLEHLNNIEGVLEEKEAIFKHTDSNNGLVFINHDDRLLKNIRRKYNHISFGYKGEPDIKGIVSEYSNDGNPKVNIQFEDKTYSFLLPLYGSASAKNFLACAAISFELGLSEKEINEGISKLTPTKGRLDVKKYKNFVLIDDTYNSNPSSMENAIELTRKIKRYKRRILICGDMLELGKSTLEKHINLYKTVKKCRVTEVYTIGKMMKYLSLKMEELGIETKHFRMKKSLLNFAETFDCDEAVILVKGSRGMKMEEVVEKIESRGN